MNLIDEINNSFSIIYTLSLPIYSLLAIIVPITLVFIWFKFFKVLKIIKDKIYIKRLYSTLYVLTFSLLYVETHSVIAVLGMKYVPYGIDNLLGCLVLVFSYFLIDSYWDSYEKFVKKKEITLFRKTLFISLILVILPLLIGNFFLEKEIYNFIISIFGIFSIIFFAFLFYSIHFLMGKLDKYSKINLFWFRYLLICIIIISLVDTIIDIFDIPPYVNLLHIPLSIIGVYIIWMCMKYVIYAEKINP